MRKQILLCAAACFLLSVLFSACQTERKANHSSATASTSPGKQDADKNKTASQNSAKTAPRNYYIANKNIARTPQKPSTPAATAVPATTTPPLAVAVPVIEPKVSPVPAPADNAANQNTNDVTIIIKDSVLPKDPELVAVTKPDTIQFKETNKDDINEPDQATTEDVVPLSAGEMDTLISKYAEMISVDRSEMSNFNLYFFIDEWYGTKYKYGGTDSTGIDCSAFSQKLYGKVYGVEILRTARQQHKHCERIKYPDDASEGDLLFFRIHRLRVSHVGVYLANGYFVHSSVSKGVVISNLNNKYWRKRFAGCGRVAKEEKSISESDYIQ